MSRIALVLLCFTILFQSVQRTWIVASWKMNQSYIASTLCENRMEKKSCCQGSCYLNKQLKENEKKQDATPLNEKLRVEYVSDLFYSSFALHRIYSLQNTIDFPKLWSSGKTKTFTGSIFHPPSYLG